MERVAQELQAAADAKERTRLLLGYAKRLPHFPEAARRDANRVMGCTAQVTRSPRVLKVWVGESVSARMSGGAAAGAVKQLLLDWV